MPSLTIITPTGGRPEAFALCERYMARQTYNKDWEWIVVDDCEPRTECTKGQKVLYPDTLWLPGGPNTQNRNLLLALEQVKSEFVAIVEDDDYYGPRHLEILCSHLEKVMLAGEFPSRYYNVKHRQFRVMPSGSHASLCQTGFRSDLIPRAKVVCGLNGATDVLLWHQVHSMNQLSKSYFEDQVVGIKGMPGRVGMGVGHSAKVHSCSWSSDSELKILQQWVGEDAELYRSYYGARNAT